MSCEVREGKREREKEGRGAGRRGRRTRARNSDLARLPDIQEEEGTGEEGFAVLGFHLGIGSMSAQELQGAQREFVRVCVHMCHCLRHGRTPWPRVMQTRCSSKRTSHETRVKEEDEERQLSTFTLGPCHAALNSLASTPASGQHPPELTPVHENVHFCPFSDRCCCCYERFGRLAHTPIMYAHAPHDDETRSP